MKGSARVPALRFVALAALAGLAACNSTSLTDTMGTASSGAPQPTVGVGSQNQQMATQQAPAMGQNQTMGQPAGQQMASVQRVPPVAFLPVTGAPQSAVTGLATAMRDAARANAVPVVVSVDRGAQYQVKGYFSALNDASGSVLVYVWDILDAKGVRIHRISGQERGGRANGDPWQGIGPDVLNRVAATTMRSLRQWELTPSAG